VKLENGEIKQCRTKGKMRLTERRSTNPVVIGDWVTLEGNEQGDDTVITEVLPRNNYIIRQSSRNRTAEHILAANLDQAMIIVSITQPMTPVGFIDRFLVTATAYRIPSIIVFNKVDLYNDKDFQQLENLTAVYKDAGYSVLITSAVKLIGMDKLTEALKGKLTLLSGNSGVGKSSLINVVAPGLNLKVGSISGYHNKGTHTTTFTETFDLPFGGEIIDMPGIREFGILDLEKEEVSHYFPEMERRRHDCQFNNCLHINEPNCAVLKAVEEGEISPTRYNSYLSIIDEIETDEKIYDKKT